MILFSCTKPNEDSPNNNPTHDDNPETEKITISVTDIDESSATLSITISSSKMYLFGLVDRTMWDSEEGDVFWNTYIDLFKQQGILSQALRIGSFTDQVANLDAQTEYVVFAAFCDKNGTRSGDLYTYTFKTSAPDVRAISIKKINSNDISQTSIIINAEIQTKRGDIVVERGVKYCKKNDKDWTTLKVPGSENTFTATISNLEIYTNYQIKAYAIIKDGNATDQQEIGTDEISVQTLAGPASLYITDVWGVGCTSANVKGQIIKLGGDYTTDDHRVGFVIGTSPNPTIDTQDVIDMINYLMKVYDNGEWKFEEYGEKFTKLKPDTKYYVRTYIITSFGVTYSEQISFSTHKIPEGAVDLGLPSGTLWSSHNLGGQKPEDFGGYYAWGETKEKGSYLSSTSTAYGKTGSLISNTYPRILLPQYDAATVIWGQGWRLPTETELQELKSKCSKKYVKREVDGNEVQGVEFTGPNGKTIFLPAAGHKEGTYFIPLDTDYWCSQIPSSTTYFADCMNFSLSGVISITYLQVYYGFPIRPVI